MGDSGDLRVLLGNAFHSVDEDHHYMGTLHGSYRTDHAVSFNLLFYLAFPAKSCSVDKNIFFSPAI